MKTILSILLTLNIISPLTASGVNSTGNTAYNNMIQISYEYGVEELSVEFAGSIGVPDIANVEASVPVPLIYTINIRCNFRKPVDSATFTINLSSYDTYRTPNVIGEYCYINSVSPSQISITAYNTDFCYIKYIYSYADIHALYGYDRNLDTQTQEWIDNGSNYVNIVRYNLSACSLTETPNYTTQLTSIFNSVDGLEGLLTTIRNNTSYISNIDTNITALLNAVNAINNKIDNINNIEWIDLNTQYKGYSTELLYNPTDLNTGTVTNNGIGYVYMYGTLPGNIASQFPLIKVVFPVEIFTIYQTFEFGFVGSNNALVKFDVLYTRSTRGAVEIYFTLDTPYYGLYDVHFCLKIIGNNIVVRPTNDKGIFYINENDINYWTVYSSLSQLNSLKGIENSLNQIITILGTTDISSTDEQNKQTVDNKFNELLQNLTLPQVPDRPSKVPFMKSLFEIFGDVINTPALDMAKWFIGIEAIVMLMGVILK